jgi:pyruvate dehydrogenase E2 component (dihydrolipoamide acetyltransferase)
MKNKHSTTIRKKLAIATWCSPKEGNIYGKITINAKNLIEYIRFIRKTSKTKVTITHLIGKAIGLSLKDNIEFNGRIILGKYIPHKTIDISFLISIENGSNLGKIKIKNIDKKKSFEIAKELIFYSNLIKNKKEKNSKKTKSLLKILPIWLLKPTIKIIGYLLSGLGFNIKLLGLRSFPFGSCIITSIGMLGINEGYAPHTPFARVPFIILVTKISNNIIVQNNKITTSPQLYLMITLDHRFIDGYQGAILSLKIKKKLENPWVLDHHKSCPWI